MAEEINESQLVHTQHWDSVKMMASSSSLNCKYVVCSSLWAARKLWRTEGRVSGLTFSILFLPWLRIQTRVHHMILPLGTLHLVREGRECHGKLAMWQSSVRRVQITSAGIMTWNCPWWNNLFYAWLCKTTLERFTPLQEDLGQNYHFMSDRVSINLFFF